MNDRKVIVLTGGPGGGKSSLIEDLRQDITWRDQFVALPETAHFARFSNISPKENLFQRLMVHTQIGLENGMDKTLGSADPRVILCHRGSLDPVAFWQKRGWNKEEFFQFTGLSLEEHYQRYAGVIHLVTSADGVPSKYTRWPQAHRPEEPEEAIILDQWLHDAWRNHPNYYQVDNAAKDWESKSGEAQDILAKLLV